MTSERIQRATDILKRYNYRFLECLYEEEEFILISGKDENKTNKLLKIYENVKGAEREVNNIMFIESNN